MEGTSLSAHVATVVDPLLPIRAMFTFSPFGLGCRQCKNNVTILIDERCIRDHLKKHGIDSKVATVRSLFEGYIAQIESAKMLGTITPYQSDKKTYTGYSCGWMWPTFSIAKG